MRVYKMITVIALIIQMTACTAMETYFLNEHMDEDQWVLHEQKKIDTFIAKQQEPIEHIAFCSSMNRAYPEFVEFFVHKERLVLSPDTLQQIKQCYVKSHKKDTTDLKLQTPLSPNPINTTHHNTKKKASSVKPFSTMRSIYINPNYSAPNMRYEEEGMLEKPFDDEKLSKKATNIYQSIVKGITKSKRNGPYLHKNSGLLFAPINENHSYVYSHDTQQFAILEKKYSFPTDTLINEIKNIFMSADQ